MIARLLYQSVQCHLRALQSRRMELLSYRLDRGDLVESSRDPVLSNGASLPKYDSYLIQNCYDLQLSHVVPKIRLPSSPKTVVIFLGLSKTSDHGSVLNRLLDATSLKTLL